MSYMNIKYHPLFPPGIQQKSCFIVSYGKPGADRDHTEVRLLNA